MNSIFSKPRPNELLANLPDLTSPAFFHALAMNPAFRSNHPMKQHILVVDDEAPARDLLSAYLKKNGYSLTTAADATEAQRLLAEKSVNFDLAILDVLLPDGDGLELLQKFKAARPRLPVIIMTGIGFDEELLQEAARKGAAAYLSKTAPLDQMLMEVQRALNYNSRKSM